MLSFLKQMSENTGLTLTYPFHVEQDCLMGNKNFDGKEYIADSSFEDTLNAVYNEPAAVSFTAEDRRYYSEQEMNLIEAVRKREMDLIQKGYVITNLDLDEDTIQMLEEYMSHTGKTLEESINEILAEAVKNPDLVQKVIEENSLNK